jgi:hypothetical protein
VYNEFTSGSPAPEPGGRTAPGPQVVPHRHIPEPAQGLVANLTILEPLSILFGTIPTVPDYLSIFQTWPGA